MLNIHPRLHPLHNFLETRNAGQLNHNGHRFRLAVIIRMPRFVRYKLRRGARGIGWFAHGAQGAQGERVSCRCMAL